MRVRPLVALALFCTLLAAAPAAAQSARSAWSEQAGRPAAVHHGNQAQVRARRMRTYALERATMARALGAGRTVEVSLPRPEGGFSRFRVRETRVMAPGLAARHPGIATYAGRGIDTPAATVRVDLTPQGFHASVREPGGTWYIDPYYQREQSLYATYRAGGHAEELVEPGPIAGREGFSLTALPPGPAVTRRTYRLALATDPAYATYHGAANVTAAKATLVNRLNQIYEEDLGIHLELIAANDDLNFNTAAEMTGANGPCGSEACFDADMVAAGCDVPLLNRNRIVLGQVVGADSFDVGHLALGIDGGGIAYLGFVGADLKAGGCTGLQPPAGDGFAVDFVAHELGHQFGGPHTFEGVNVNCNNQTINVPTAVEPGSGTTVMAYAGICGADNLQKNSDPYFGQQSVEDITKLVTTNFPSESEIQTVSLRSFDSGDSFRLTFDGAESAPIELGPGYTASKLEETIEAINGGVPVQVSDFGSDFGQPSTAGFQVTFSGNVNRQRMTLTSASGLQGFVGVTRDGGAPLNKGFSAEATANRAPVVETPAAFTIPVRTPFTLTGNAEDADGDALSYLWEQNDAGSGKALLSNTKTGGPLFRVFGDAATIDPEQDQAAGHHVASPTPQRTFPDMAQIAANNTNAAGGTCAAGNVECFSEFLPTAAYTQPLHFRLTARDGNPVAGGTGFADTTLTPVPTAGPFLVQNPAGLLTGGTATTITWNVANTNLAPVSAADVRISLSADGGLTFPHEMVASTPNDGAATVTVPNVDSTTARVKVEAVGNVFFDINDTNFTVEPAQISASDSGDVAVPYGDAPPAMTVTGTHDGADGDQLNVSAPALPGGLQLTVDSTTADGVRPGQRVWRLTGNALDAPGTYPVVATVAEGGVSAPTSFAVTITDKPATVAYDGPATFTGEQGAVTASVPLSAKVSATGAGDLANATVTFLADGQTLCTAPADATGQATCNGTLGAGAHDLDLVVGGHYTGAGSGAVSVSFPAFSATPSGATTVQYSDGFGGALTVTAEDEDSAGTALQPGPVSLPAGLSLTEQSTGAHTRTWAVAGTTTAAPGSHPASVTVSDGAGHTAVANFTITVTREDATVTSATDPTATGTEGEATAAVTLRATLTQDAPAGDLANASVTFKAGGATLCSDPSAAAGAAECVAQLAPGHHDFTIEAGGFYTGAGTGAVDVTIPPFTAENGGDVTVQYSDAPAGTVSASDATTPGSGLTATPAGLPAGLSLAVKSTGAGLPGTRTWALQGVADAAPGSYPVHVEVTDGEGHRTATDFTVTVTREDAVAAFTGVPGRLSAQVSEPADGTPGDLSFATLSFSEAGAALCADLPVSAACTVALGAGTHTLRMTVGGRYAGAADAGLVVPAAVAPRPTPVPTVAPRPAPALALSRSARTVRVRRNAFKLKLACAPAGAACRGKLTIKAKRRTIATARYAVTGTRTITVKLNARGRRALKKRKPLAVKLTAGGLARSFKLRR